jgi:hypothetical protein
MGFPLRSLRMKPGSSVGLAGLESYVPSTGYDNFELSLPYHNHILIKDRFRSCQRIILPKSCLTHLLLYLYFQNKIKIIKVESSTVKCIRVSLARLLNTAITFQFYELTNIGNKKDT